MTASDEYVEAASRQIGLPIADGDLARVKEDMARIAGIADFLMRFTLSQETEAAPVFQP